MPYKHAIWDWNGTLLNDTLLCVEVLNGLLARRGRAPITPNDYRENFGFPVIRFYEYLGFDADSDTFEQVSREFIGDYEKRWFDECILYPDAHEVLSIMTQQGMTHSVRSAAKQDTLESGIQHFGIHKYFMGIVGVNNIYAEGKVAQGKQWIKQLPWKPNELLMIGDTLHDLEVAEAIGAECILLAHGHHAPERHATSGKRVVHSLGELIEVMR